MHVTKLLQLLTALILTFFRSSRGVKVNLLLTLDDHNWCRTLASDVEMGVPEFPGKHALNSHFPSEG